MQDFAGAMLIYYQNGEEIACSNGTAGQEMTGTDSKSDSGNGTTEFPSKNV